MSAIVDFRQRIIDAINAAAIPDLVVDWYDGLFDETDIDEWVVKTPAAFVSVQNVPKADHHVTGEMNLDLRCIVAVITSDSKEPRSADAEVWSIMEQIMVMANLNKFADPNGAPATDLKFRRLRDPGLRREGVALGVVEWSSGLTIGINKSVAHEFVKDPATGVIPNMSANLFLGLATVSDYIGDTSQTETVDLTPSDPAFPGDTDS